MAQDAELPAVFDSPRFPSLASVLIDDPSLLPLPLNNLTPDSVEESIRNCFRKLNLAVRVVQDNSYLDYRHLTDVRTYYNRCLRGMTYQEFSLSFPSSSSTSLIEDYFWSKRERMKSLLSAYEQQCSMSANPENGIFEIVAKKGSPTDLDRKGNFYLTSIHHLEHHAEQLEYLVSVVNALPYPFLDIVFSIRYKIIPEIVLAQGGIECLYDATKQTSSEACPANFRRSNYLLNPWMTDLMQGTFNTLTHMPVAKPITSTDPFCLNPDLNFEEIQDSFLAGKVLVIDNLLTDACHSELRKLALEGTIFYEGKKSYLGAYIDEGMGESPWLLKLSEEWQKRFPKIINDLPLSTSWFYKYDSTLSDIGGIGIHADQAIVNINIWLTPDSANLDPDSGGLIIYDAAPPADEVFSSENFEKWNNEIYGSFRKEWLEENGAKHLKIPYRFNRAVVFDSRRLHETDKYNFKLGYENRRINLTLLFGIGGNVEGADDVGTLRGDGDIFPNEFSVHK